MTRGQTLGLALSRLPHEPSDPDSNIETHYFHCNWFLK